MSSTLVCQWKRGNFRGHFIMLENLQITASHILRQKGTLGRSSSHFLAHYRALHHIFFANTVVIIDGTFITFPHKQVHPIWALHHLFFYRRALQRVLFYVAAPQRALYHVSSHVGKPIGHSITYSPLEGHLRGHCITFSHTVELQKTPQHVSSRIGTP